MRIDLTGDSTQTDNAGYGRGFCANLTAKVDCINMAKGGSTRVTVSATGQYKTVQDAVDHAPESGAVILIAPGTYKEKIQIKSRNIWLVGTGSDPKAVVLTFGDSSKNTGSTFNSGTVTVDADGFEAENLSIVNTWWDEHPDPADASQAVALQVSSDHAVIDRVRILSGQDTLYAASRSCRSSTDTSPCLASRQFFNDCYIEGHVDYIFGDAKAVFQGCELHSRSRKTIMITAQSRHSLAEDSGYYFLNCRITGADEGGHVYLGRPWRDYATVLFYDTDIQQKIAPEGWSEWGGRLKTSTYLEYKSHGEGANLGHRVVQYPALSPEQEQAITPAHLLHGPDAWDSTAALIALRAQVHLQ